MTLIAAVKDESGFTVVADTKVTYEDDAIQTARVFTFALPKIVLLRDELVVAIAGDKPTELVRQLIQHRENGLTEIIDDLRQVKNAGFIVASVTGPSIWTVGDGVVDLVSDGQLAMEGDSESFDDFKALYEGAVDVMGGSGALIAAMDQLAGPLGRHSSVGGYCLAATTLPEGVRFLSRATTIAPRGEEVSAIDADGRNVRISTTLSAANSAWYQSLVLGGRDSTPGAVGVYIAQARAGRLWAHETPYESELISASDVDEFVASALARGQTLQLARSPFPFMP